MNDRMEELGLFSVETREMSLDELEHSGGW